MTSVEEDNMLEENKKNDSMIEAGNLSASESEVKAGSENKILFKKPQIGLIIGPRKGKITAKVRSLEPSKAIEIQGTDAAVDDLVVELDTKLHDSSVAQNDEPPPKQTEKDIPKSSTERKSSNSKTGLSPAQQLAENIPIPYREPKWGSCPVKKYSFEVLKSGKILENVDLTTKSFYVFGRLVNCDVVLAHPTISRHHAVLQYRSEGSEVSPRGFYIYDFGSTHGTFLNKNKIKPSMYVRVHVGHILKFGCSTRLFVLQGPPEDEEEESELSVTELKAKRNVERIKRLQEGGAPPEEEEGSDGIDWGMSEDADEETDLAVNPFAATANEELYLDDPKKTLRGWFEREGEELEYDVEERGIAQFICKVELPIEAARGGVVMAEAIVHGKKKEAVLQCALEACRILDRYGLLRQATHESKKRKARDWESEDFYDSDEDTFLDRTGTVEQKRQARMRAAGRREVLTYQTLVEQHEKVSSELRDVEAQLRRESSKGAGAGAGTAEDEDELDAFMNALATGVKDKMLISKLKTSMTSLKAEESRLRKLVNIARPASLPELKPHATEATSSAAAQTTTEKMTAFLGKARKQIKSKHGHAPKRATPVEGGVQEKGGGEEKEEEDEEDDDEVKEEEPMKRPTVKDAPKPETSRHKADHRDPPPPEVPDERKGKEEGGNKYKEKSEDQGVEKMEVEAEMESSAKELSEKEIERRKRRNRQRMMQRNAKMHKESKQSSWSGVDSSDPSLYSTWTPPVDQSGDGRTSLNKKLGY